MILSDRDIMSRLSDGSLVIEPFAGSKTRYLENTGVPCASYGLSSAGYDLRLGTHVSRMLPQVGPLSAQRPPVSKIEGYQEGEEITLMPNECILATTFEKVSIPKDCIATVEGKSTHARIGVLCNVTPLEPGWTGYVTMSFSNVSQYPVSLVCGEGVAQMMLHALTSEPEEDYGDGKYQNSGDTPVGARL